MLLCVQGDTPYLSTFSGCRISTIPLHSHCCILSSCTRYTLFRARGKHPKSLTTYNSSSTQHGTHSHTQWTQTCPHPQREHKAPTRQEASHCSSSHLLLFETFGVLSCLSKSLGFAPCPQNLRFPLVLLGLEPFGLLLRLGLLSLFRPHCVSVADVMQGKADKDVEKAREPLYGALQGFCLGWIYYGTTVS